MKIRKAEEEKKAMFGKKKDARARVPSSPETRYQSARSSLLLVVVLTAINLLLLVMRSSTQFLFSASFPSYLYIIADEFADASFEVFGFLAAHSSSVHAMHTTWS